MSETQTAVTGFDWNAETAENGDQREFVNFDDNGQVLVTFEENEPFKTLDATQTKFKNKLFLFRVKDHAGTPAIFSTGSKRCLGALKTLLPLAGKAVCISRAGQGMDTQYKAELI